METPKDIHELLERLDKQTPFKVPEGYFEELEERVIQRVSEGYELDKQLPFEVPEGYFSNFADKVIEKVTEEEPVRVVSIWRRASGYAAAAVLLVGLVFGIYYSKLPEKNTNTAEISFEDVSTEELLAALENDVDLYLIEQELAVGEVTEEDVEEVIDKKDSAETEQEEQEELIEEEVKDIPEDELEEYLLDNMDEFLLDEI